MRKRSIVTNKTNTFFLGRTYGFISPPAVLRNEAYYLYHILPGLSSVFPDNSRKTGIKVRATLLLAAFYPGQRADRPAQGG